VDSETQCSGPHPAPHRARPGGVWAVADLVLRDAPHVRLAVGESGGSLEKLSKAFGYASLNTSERYAHLRPDLFLALRLRRRFRRARPSRRSARAAHARSGLKSLRLALLKLQIRWTCERPHAKDAEPHSCQLSSGVEQRFRKPQVWGSNPQAGSGGFSHPPAHPHRNPDPSPHLASMRPRFARVRPFR
jgi:hypothetical protein